MNDTAMSEKLWVAQGYHQYFGWAETLARDEKRARARLNVRLPVLLLRKVGGRPVIAVGLNSLVKRARPIPHLGYDRTCSSGCAHSLPPPDRQAWRFFGLWTVVGDGEGDDPLEEGPMTFDLEGVYVVVAGKMATSGQDGPGRLGLP
jgi:hypothetical protein